MLPEQVQQMSTLFYKFSRIWQDWPLLGQCGPIMRGTYTSFSFCLHFLKFNYRWQSCLCCNLNETNGDVRGPREFKKISKTPRGPFRCLGQPQSCKCPTKMMHMRITLGAILLKYSSTFGLYLIYSMLELTYNRKPFKCNDFRRKWSSLTSDLSYLQARNDHPFSSAKILMFLPWFSFTGKPKYDIWMIEFDITVTQAIALYIIITTY